MVTSDQNTIDDAKVQLERAARQAFAVLASYDAASKGAQLMSIWQTKRLEALHELRDALERERNHVNRT